MCVCVYECTVIVQPFGSTSIDLLAVQRAHLTTSMTFSLFLTVQRPIVDIKNRPRIPIPDEDPYSVAGNGSNGSSGSSGFGSGHQQQLQQQQHQQQQLGKHLNNGSSGHVAATREQLLLQTQQLAHKRSEKPPKLPPRDNVYAHDLIPKVSQLAANWQLRLPKCFVGECRNTCCLWSSCCFLVIVVVVVDARNKNNIFGSAKTHIIRARSVATSSAPTTTTTRHGKNNVEPAMLGYMHNAGTCKMVYGSDSLCPPHAPVPASPSSCSHPRSSVAQTSDWGWKIPGHLLRRRFRCGHCRRLRLRLCLCLLRLCRQASTSIWLAFNNIRISAAGQQITANESRVINMHGMLPMVSPMGPTTDELWALPVPQSLTATLSLSRQAAQLWLTVYTYTYTMCVCVWILRRVQPSLAHLAQSGA